MAFENLDFSSWSSGSKRYAEGMKEAKTTKAKAKAEQMRGLESAIGLVLGAGVGGYFGGLEGAVAGANIGGGLMSGDMTRAASGLSALKDIGDSPSWMKKLSGAQEASLAMDPGQAASALNMSGREASAMGILRGMSGGDVVDQYVGLSKLGGGLV